MAIGNSVQIPIRILLDSGSQLSYITNTLQERLQVKSTRKERLNINTFGNSSFRVQDCDIVRFRLCKGESSERIEVVAYTSPVICTPLPKLFDVQQYKHLQGLELADSDQEEQTIKVLIRSDCYWAIVTGQMIVGDQGPVALRRKLGWLLSGPLSNHSKTLTTHSHVIIHGA